jgi:hypothetical protein
MEQGISEIVEGALIAVAPVVFASWSLVLIDLKIDILAAAMGTL